jgi:hypothetical protein
MTGCAGAVTPGCFVIFGGFNFSSFSGRGGRGDVRVLKPGCGFLVVSGAVPLGTCTVVCGARRLYRFVERDDWAAIFHFISLCFWWRVLAGSALAEAASSIVFSALPVLVPYSPSIAFLSLSFSFLTYLILRR